METFEDIRQCAAKFVSERNWQQFQSPKNLVMALNVEVGELMEHFQWRSAEESSHLSKQTLQNVSDEIADVQLYLVRLADELNINIFEAVAAKAKKNKEKYPVEQVKESARQYTDYV